MADDSKKTPDYQPHDGMAVAIAVHKVTGEVRTFMTPIDNNVCGPHCVNLESGTAQKGNQQAFASGWERTFGSPKNKMVS